MFENIYDVSLTGNNGELFNSSPKIQPTALNTKKKKTVEIREFSPHLSL